MQTLEDSFKELITLWDNSHRDTFVNLDYRKKYRSYRANYKAGHSIGPKIKLEMLRKAGYELIMVKAQLDKEPGQNSPIRNTQEP